MVSFMKETIVELSRQESGVARKRRNSRQRTQVHVWETLSLPEMVKAVCGWSRK